MLIHMEGLTAIIDALGGVNISLAEPMGGLSTGQHHLSGSQALAFVRERSSGSDFSRMRQNQILIQAITGRIMSPASWPRIPELMVSSSQVVETNIPIWQWPRLAFSILRAPIFGVDAHTITPEMVTPSRSLGAQYWLQLD
jgi:anionic cell wall polymer biosynthesis LytR-Cps2A-Psr (LCP) family protein